MTTTQATPATPAEPPADAAANGDSVTITAPAARPATPTAPLPVAPATPTPPPPAPDTDNTVSTPVQLPADHPLVTALAAQKAENAGLRARAAKVEQSAVAAALKEHMVSLHQIDADDADLLLTGDTPELLLRQVARLLEGRPGKKKAVVAREGGNPNAAETGDMREFARGLFGRSD